MILRFTNCSNGFSKAHKTAWIATKRDFVQNGANNWSDIQEYIPIQNNYILSSRRASAQALTSKWQLHTTSPMSTNSSAGENSFLAKKRVVAGPFMNQSEKFQRVKRPKFRWRRSRRFSISRWWPETGRFGRFSGPRGPKKGCDATEISVVLPVGPLRIDS